MAMVSRPRIKCRRNRYMLGSDADDKMVNCESSKLCSEHAKVHEGLEDVEVDEKWSCGTVCVCACACLLCLPCHPLMNDETNSLLS